MAVIDSFEQNSSLFPTQKHTATKSETISNKQSVHVIRYIDHCKAFIIGMRLKMESIDTFAVIIIQYSTVDTIQ